MAHETKKESLKDRTVGAGTVAAAVVVLILFFVWMTYAYFGSGIHIASADERFMQQKAEECQGDIRKLSEKDQATLTKMMGRQAGMGISSMYSAAHHPRSHPFW